MKGRLFLVCFVVFFSLACGFAAFAAEPYNLGVALGFTGTGTLYSKDQMEGVQLAVEEINAKGGL